MNWKAELDTLVEETMAFAKAVNGAAVKPIVPLALVEAALAERSLPAAQSLPARIAPMVWPETEREEIKQRVANFRAHQERMQRDREDYAARTMSNAGLGEAVSLKS